VPGIDGADAYSVPWYNPGEGGLFSSRGLDLMLWVSISPEVHIADGEQFLRAMAAAAWSINDGYSPDGSVVLIVRRGLDRHVDWMPAARAVFGDEVSVSDDVRASLSDTEVPLTDEDVVLSIRDDLYREVFGEWPAAPGEVPDALFAEGPPATVLPPAVSDFRTAIISGGGTCLVLSFTRGVDARQEPYRADVAVTLMHGGTPESTVLALGSADDAAGGDTAARFCGDDTLADDDVTFHVVAPAAPGFLAVDRLGVRDDG